VHFSFLHWFSQIHTLLSPILSPRFLLQPIIFSSLFQLHCSNTWFFLHASRSHLPINLTLVSIISFIHILSHHFSSITFPLQHQKKIKTKNSNS
jgi:hypothetical protein